MKKQNWIVCLLILLIVTALPVTAFASGEEEAKLNHITDLYGLLSQEEAEALEAQAKTLSREYECSFYVLVVKDYRDYASSTFRFTMDTYESYRLGWGNEKNGTMLMLSMADRDFEMVVHGSRTEEAFTEYGRDQLEDRVLSYLRNDDFYGGFWEYLNTCGEYMEAARNGKPVDRERGFSILFFLPGLFASIISSTVLAAPMKSVGTKHDANQYMAEGRVNLQERTDLFLRRTVARRPRQTSSSGGSHGSTHSSGGYSGRSGKF